MHEDGKPENAVSGQAEVQYLSTIDVFIEYVNLARLKDL